MYDIERVGLIGVSYRKGGFNRCVSYRKGGFNTYIHTYLEEHVNAAAHHEVDREGLVPRRREYAVYMT
jgi:hypothetical protein